MEIMIPSADFDFNSARSTPYASTPATPRRFGEYYLSAPPSPGHLSEFYRDFDDFYVDDSKSCSEVPIGWEEKPRSPKLKGEKTVFDGDFAFDVSGEFEEMTLPAEELFDGGKIRPLKTHSRLKPENREDQSRDLKGSIKIEKERGRERNPSSLPSSSSRRTRSVSPYRVSKYPWEEEEEEERGGEQPSENRKQFSVSGRAESTSTSSSLSSNPKSASRKWRLRDFFLFRSASEGRASSKDPLRKYAALFKKNDEVKSSSFRSTEGGSVSKRKVPASAHEKHYAKNRAASEDLKRKTFLPYKRGILGRLSFNPAVHALSNGFGFSRK